MPGSCERETETDEGKLPVYCIRVKNRPDSLQLMEAVRMEGAYPDGSFRDFVVDRLLLQKLCCRKAYLRGIFLLTGSVSNPEKSYHLELVCPDLEEADLIVWLMQSLGFDPRVIGRQNHQVVYLKECEGHCRDGKQAGKLRDSESDADSRRVCQADPGYSVPEGQRGAREAPGESEGSS